MHKYADTIDVISKVLEKLRASRHNKESENVATHMLCLKIMQKVMAVHVSQMQVQNGNNNIDSMARELTRALECLGGNAKMADQTLGILNEADKTCYYQEVKSLVKMVLQGWEQRELRRDMARQERKAADGASDTDRED